MSTRELIFEYTTRGARRAAQADKRVRSSVEKTGRTAQKNSGAVERWMERNRKAIGMVAAATAAAAGSILAASPTIRAQLSGVRAAFTLFSDTIVRDLLPAGESLGSKAVDLAQKFQELDKPTRTIIGGLVILAGIIATVGVVVGGTAALVVGAFLAQVAVTAMLLEKFGALKPVINGFKDVVRSLIALLRGDYSAAWDFAKDALEDFARAGKAYLGGLLGFVSDRIATLALIVIKGATLLRQRATQEFAQLRDRARQRLGELADTARQKARDARDGVVRFIGKLRSRALDLLSLGRELTEKGKQWVQGLVSGVRQRASTLADAFRSMAGRVARAFKNRFNELIPSSISIPSVTVDIPDLLGGGSRRVGGGALSLPQLNTGGRITGSGLAMLHEGERVMPAAQVRDRGRQPAGNGDTIVERVVIQVVDSGDPQRTGRDIGREFEKALESRGA